MMSFNFFLFLFVGLRAQWPMDSGTTITSVTPSKIQRTTARTLQIVIENLPQLPGNFVCAFSALGKTLMTNATKTNTGVSCTTPRNDLLPLIPSGESHFTSKLSVKPEHGPFLVSTNFTFFDCNSYSSCTTCVSSFYPCDWCIDGHRCTHDTAENCRNDILVTGINRIGPSIRSGPTFCPRVNATLGGSPEILVSSGLQKSIQVKVDHIAQFIIQTRFVCQFNIEGRVTSVNAQLLADTIYCDDMEFTYTSRVPNITATFAVIWGQSKPLDNPNNIHVLIYRCKDMANNCGMCLSLDEKYQCGWCQATKKCEVKNQCGNDVHVSWLDRKQTCPNISITKFYPEYGPWEGGTNITIHGINLGKNFADISRGVTVAGMACDPYEELYIRTSKIVCKVDGPGTREKRRGPIIVKVLNFRGESNNNFEFVDPVINDIEPRHGPKSGGTKVKIMGEYLNAGSNIEATMGYLPCKIVRAEKKHAICITSGSYTMQKLDVKMTFDHGRARVLKGKKYKYVEDPKIEFAFSGNTGQSKTPKGIPSGGINITVRGSNFLYIQDPEMYVLHADKQFKGGCRVATDRMMFCQSPYVASLDKRKWMNKDYPKPIKLDYGFIMDNVARVQNLSSQLKVSKFVSFYPDPEFSKFDDPNGIKLHNSDYLTLNGKNLNRAAKESDIKVRIGTQYCNVTSLSLNQLTCKPPDHQPPALVDGKQDPNELPDVVVMIGDRLKFNVGKLDYNVPGTAVLAKLIYIKYIFQFLKHSIKKVYDLYI